MAAASLRSNKIRFQGAWYATLDDAKPDERQGGIQADFIELPKGWQLAPNDPEVVRGVIAAHGWSTNILVVEDGSGFRSSNCSPAGPFYSSGLLVRQGNSYRPDRANLRVLIRTDAAAAPADPGSDYTQDLCAQMWEAREFADCTVACAGEEIACHRAVLSSASPVFAQMFRSEMKEAAQRRVDIGEADPSAVMAMARFMYTGKLPEETGALIPLLSLADRYDIQRLASACAVRLISANELTVDNVVEVVRAMRPFAAKDDFSAAWQELSASVRDDPGLHSAVMQHL